jgi:hypothetical protein
MEQEEAPHDSHQSTPPFSQTPTNHSSTSFIQFGSPFIVLTEGECSGTTSSVGHYIRNIVSMHNFHEAEHVTFEFLNADQYNDPRKHKYKNQYYQDIVTERNMTDGNHSIISVEAFSSLRRCLRIIDRKSYGTLAMNSS